MSRTKTVSILLAVLGATCGIQIAQALDVTALLVAIPVAIGEYTTAAVLLPTATTAGTAASDVNDKAIYYQSLREDAVLEIADGSAPSAVLMDAINQIRTQTGTELSDREISIQIMKALN